jgi:UDP-N-acetylglucosamine--N-acetylmuramyl-(pentapeptide) pyrophosphoryl-undecaprenol N-acetylglucosamine transferase
VYPAITVLEALGLEKDLVLWVGGRGGMEESLVTRNNISFTTIPAAGVHGVGLVKLPGNIWELIKGLFSSRQILKQFNPDVLFFTGGYIAFPMAVAAIGKPSVLYVPDIEPGLALKALARFASRIALTTDTSSRYFPNPPKLTVTGYPVRPGLQEWTREKALAYFDFDPNLPTLTVAGGSKGARSINTAIMKILPRLLEEMQVIHLVGHLDWELIDSQAQKLSPGQTKRYQAFPYLHEMGAALAAPNLIISRAGASILGEYPLFNLPAILVPYPHAWRYQQVNAEYLAERGAAVILRDEELDQALYSHIHRLMADPAELLRMSQAMATLAVPDAATKIADLMRELAGNANGGLPT